MCYHPDKQHPTSGAFLRHPTLLRCHGRQHSFPKKRRLGDVSLILDSTFSQTGFPFGWCLTLVSLVNQTRVITNRCSPMISYCIRPHSIHRVAGSLVIAPRESILPSASFSTYPFALLLSFSSWSSFSLSSSLSLRSSSLTLLSR